MKKLHTFYTALFLIIFLSACNPKESNKHFFQINENLEIHSSSFNINEKESFRIISHDSEELKNLKNYINDLDNLKEVKHIRIAPSYTVIGKHIKIVINPIKIGIQYLNSKNEIINLVKKVHHEERFFFGNLFSKCEKTTLFDNLYATGKFKMDEYTFCGIAPVRVKYWHKIGKWKFWNKKRNLIAEGIFSTQIDSVLDQGGCSFPFKSSKIEPINWKFYDNEGKIIPPSIDQIFRLENLKRQ